MRWWWGLLCTRPTHLVGFLFIYLKWNIYLSNIKWKGYKFLQVIHIYFSHYSIYNVISWPQLNSQIILFYLRLWRQHTRLVFFPSVKLYMKYQLLSSYFKVHEKVCFWNFIKKTKNYHQMDNLPLELTKKVLINF